MRIRKLCIRNFGKIKNRTLVFSEGINILYGKNESGKTTFYHFLKGMFYGIARKRGRGAGKDIYSIYEPWEEPASYGGVLWMEAGEKNYRLRRDFYREAPKTELLDETLWQELDPEMLEEILGGVSEAVYENTVSIGQLRSVTGPDLARELTSYMMATQGAADSRISLERAVQFLKMNRKGFLEMKERNYRERRKSFDKLEGQEEYLKKDLLEIEAKTEELLETKEEFLKTREPAVKDPEYENRNRELEMRRLGNRRRMGAAGAAGLLSFAFLAAAALSFGTFLQMMLLGAVSLICIGYCGYCLAAGRKIERRIRLNEAAKRRDQARRRKREENLERMGWDAQHLAGLKQDRLVALENLNKEKEEYEASLGLPVAEDTEIEAINLALEKISEASGAIRRQLGTRLRERTSQILCEITDGKYREILVDDHFHLSLNLEDRSVDLERLSRGTVEQVYFALRMASGELMCWKESFPVILDDVFGMYDDERLAAVLRWLERQNRQIIICTCSKREEEMMLAEGIRFNGIEL